MGLVQAIKLGLHKKLKSEAENDWYWRSLREERKKQINQIFFHLIENQMMITKEKKLKFTYSKQKKCKKTIAMLVSELYVIFDKLLDQHQRMTDLLSLLFFEFRKTIFASC